MGIGHCHVIFTLMYRDTTQHHLYIGVQSLAKPASALQQAQKFYYATIYRSVARHIAPTILGYSVSLQPRSTLSPLVIIQSLSAPRRS